MEDLKGCPFCGGEAFLWSGYGRYGYFAYCKCDICGATSKTFSLGDSLPDDWENMTASRKAVNAWNRRYDNAQQNY